MRREGMSNEACVRSEIHLEALAEVLDVILIDTYLYHGIMLS